MDDSRRESPRLRRPRPEPIGELVTAAFERLDIAERVERAAAIADWDQIVGEHIARVARPLRIREGTLFVAVQSAAWMMELNMMRHELLERLNAGKRRGRLERVVLVQADGGTSGAVRADRGRRSPAAGEASNEDGEQEPGRRNKVHGESERGRGGEAG